MSAEILNLDELETAIEKTIVHKGQKHVFAPFSVKDFVENLKQIEAYSKQDEIPVSEYMEHMINMVVRSFPSLGEDEVRELPMPKLKAINDFIKGQTETEALEGVKSDPDAVKN